MRRIRSKLHDFLELPVVTMYHENRHDVVKAASIQENSIGAFVNYSIEICRQSDRYQEAAQGGAKLSLFFV
jgi:hypothetical protein